MRSRPWSRPEVIAELRDRLWLHVSPAATAHDTVLQASALLQLPPADVARLGRLQFVLDPAVRTLVEAAPSLLRRLANNTRATTEVSVDRVRGPVDWPATTRRRALDRTPVVVARPVVRDDDVQPNRTMALLLHAIVTAADDLRLSVGAGVDDAVGRRVAELGRRAAELAAHRALRDVTPAAPSARELAALAGPRFARRYAALVAAWTAYDALVRRVDAPAVRAAVEQRGFAVTEAGALFELLVLFRVRTALDDAGWAVERARLIEGTMRFAAARGGQRLTVWFQGMPEELSAASAYRAAQHTHGFGRVHDLRPDLVLGLETPGGVPTRWLVVEAKTAETERSVPELARRALLDLLAYRSAYTEHLEAQVVWGLGVVWGHDLDAVDHQVGLCTPDRLAQALDVALTS